MQDNSAELPPSFVEVADALGLGMAFRIHASADGASRRFVYVSPCCRQMTGVDPAAALADPSVLYGQILPEHRDALEAAERAALAERRRFDAEVRMRREDGEVRWRRITSTPTVLADGSTVWDGLLMDITEAKEAEAELLEQRGRLEAAVEATGLGLWEWNVRTGEIVWSDRNRALFGVTPDEPVDIQRYMKMVHPEDLPGVQAVYREAAGQPEGGDFVVEHRVAGDPGGKPRWLHARGRVVKDEGGVKLVVGATLDVSDRKAHEERRTLLMSELAHRAKNGIAVMMAIVTQTARSAGSVKEFEGVLMARLKAMADSQDLVMASGGRPVALGDVVARTLTPFDTARFQVDARLSEVTIAGEVAVSLGLLLHELSTNAVKYGALSAPGGRVVIERAEGADGEAVLKWAERDGPEVRPGKRKGFGSRLLEVSLRPLGGGVEPSFEPAGFKANIRFPVARPRSPAH